MNVRVKQLYADLDRFISHYEGHQIKYIRLKPKDYLLLVESLPYFQKQIAHKKNHVEYRDFTVIPEK